MPLNAGIESVEKVPGGNRLEKGPSRECAIIDDFDLALVF